MTTLIHPRALRSHRERKRWTQQQLADHTRGKNKVSLPTIKRIESTKAGNYPANDRVADALANALGVSARDLSIAPSEEADRNAALHRSGYRSLRTMIDPETALAFRMVQHIFGISIRSQIEMAPLFAALLAEGSLAWRTKRVDAIEDAADHLSSLGGGHFSFAHAGYRAMQGAAAERASIASRDLFGKDVGDDAFDLGFDPSMNNPFADYLGAFAKEIPARTVRIETDLGWKTSEGFPAYTIGADIIFRVTGDDPDAEYALLHGYVQLTDIPEQLLGDEREADRIAWIIARIPPDELAERRAARNELAKLVDPLITDNGTPAPTSKGSHHA